MKYVDFCGHKISKLIVGDNPFNGHTYIPDIFPRDEVLNYHTEEKILEAIYRMEELGINTMLPLADPYIIRILSHYRANGGKMNFIFQLYAPMITECSLAQIKLLDAIGVYVPGSFTDLSWETDKNQDTLDLLEQLRSIDIPVGIGTHNPKVIELSEKENWNPDFYMACMYDFRKDRRGELSGFLTGKSKAGIQYYPEDREIMLETLKKVDKPILAFKLFAGGQLFLDKTEEEKRAAIKEAYDTVFSALKPNDAGVIGIYQKHSDQLGEDIGIFNEWAEEKNI